MIVVGNNMEEDVGERYRCTLKDEEDEEDEENESK